MKFPKATFYSCDGRETLWHKDPEEAVTAFLEDCCLENQSFLDAIQSVSPLQVSCYKRRKVDRSWIRYEVEALLETLYERFQEEYCAADDNSEILTVTSETIEIFADAADKALKKLVPYDCEEIAVVELSAKEVEEMMRSFNPEWFEDDA